MDDSERSVPFLKRRFHTNGWLWLGAVAVILAVDVGDFVWSDWNVEGGVQPWSVRFAGIPFEALKELICHLGVWLVRAFFVGWAVQGVIVVWLEAIRECRRCRGAN